MIDINFRYDLRFFPINSIKTGLPKFTLPNLLYFIKNESGLRLHSFNKRNLENLIVESNGSQAAKRLFGLPGNLKEFRK